MSVLTIERAKPKLREAYAQRQLIPFLGSGFSAPLGLPQWGELMGWMSKPLGFDPALFELNGPPPQLAGYYELESAAGLSPFIAQMRERFHDPKAEALRRESPQHRALARLDFRRIYTTNFEHHVEEALRDAGKQVDVRVRVEDFMRPTRESACQVVKFHGDLDLGNEDTVVLTERQFFERMRLEAAPDQCLRADLLGNVFLFIGYSFSDTNIRDIWHRMERLRRDVRPRAKGLSPLQLPRSLMTTFGAGVVQPRLLEQLHIDMIELDPTDKSRSVVELLDIIGGGSP